MSHLGGKLQPMPKAKPDKQLNKKARMLASEIDYFVVQVAGSLTKDQVKVLEHAVKVLYDINRAKQIRIAQTAGS